MNFDSIERIAILSDSCNDDDLVALQVLRCVAERLPTLSDSCEDDGLDVL